MSIKKMTKEELELLSFTDITNLILQEEKELSTSELFQQITKLLEKPQSFYESKIGDYYTSLTIDKRFILLTDGKWDLKTRHIIKPTIVLDDDEEIDDLEQDDVVADFDEEVSDDFDETDDDTADANEEYKNLVIIDEEDLDIEQ